MSRPASQDLSATLYRSRWVTWLRDRDGIAPRPPNSRFDKREPARELDRSRTQTSSHQRPSDSRAYVSQHAGHGLQRDFRTIIQVRKVLRRRKDHGGLQKSLRTEQRGQTNKRIVDPLLLFERNGQLRSSQAKHVTVISELTTRARMPLNCDP